MQKKTAMLGFAITITLAAVLLVIAVQSQDSSITGNAVQVELVDSVAEEHTQAISDQPSGSLNKAASSLEFEGFALGGLKSHAGTFDDWTATAEFDDTTLISLSGSIMADSVNTGIDGLDSHLRSGDFFDTTNHPEITFTATTIGSDQITGELTFRGVTQEITFPAQVSEKTITADFTFDASEFGFDAFGVSNEVSIMSEFVFN